MTTTSDVLDHHLKSFGARDLDGIMADFAPGAVLFTPDGPLRGTAAIRTLFVALLAEFSKPGATFRLRHRTVDGDYAYIVWSAETADNVYELVTDTFVVRDGRIAVQSFAAKLVPKLPGSR
ncbi:MAG: nuclear transport factor 2 family protein [Burkholderiales bacterium]